MSGVHTHNMSDHLYSYPFKELHDCYLALDQSFQVQRLTELLIDYRKVPKKVGQFFLLTNIPLTPLTLICPFSGENVPQFLFGNAADVCEYVLNFKFAILMIIEIDPFMIYVPMKIRV